MVFMILCFVVCVQFPYTPSNSLTICRQVNSSQRTRLASAIVDNVAPGRSKTMLRTVSSPVRGGCVG
jgi:hypothetical protein